MTETSRFDMLFQPFQLGPMVLRNRIVMPPMGINAATEEGYVTQRVLDYYEKRAQGGVGLVIVEATCVDRSRGKDVRYQLALDDDKCIPGLTQLARVIQRWGAKAAIQLHHAGGTTSQALNRNQLVAPSPLSAMNGSLAKELTKDEIHDIIALFAQGAARARESGFDAVEVHGASNHLVAQFLSSKWNKRQDNYGGNIENRARFLLEILSVTRGVVGPVFPLWPRLNGIVIVSEGDPGYGLEDAIAVAQMAVKAGAYAVHVSRFAEGGRRPPSAVPPGDLLPVTEAIKKAVNIPVIASSRIDPALGDRALREGKADLISIGRALIADPELPRKVREGRGNDVIPCILCNTCAEVMRPRQVGGAAMHCVVNATACKEHECAIVPSVKHKRVLVIGGGPAGLETARVAALRGHGVILWEKEKRLGGQLYFAAIPPYKETLKPLLDFLVNQIYKLGVKVELEKEATLYLVRQMRPEAVVLTTGATPIVPQIPGIEKGRVISALEALAGEVEVGNRVAIIGGERVGCEVAEFLAKKGKSVTIMRRGPHMATRVESSRRHGLLERLTYKGVTLLPGVNYEKITADGLVVTLGEGESRTIAADSIILAAGARPNSELFPALQKEFPTYLAGDAIEPRGLLEAIHEGAAIGRAL